MADPVDPVGAAGGEDHPLPEDWERMACGELTSSEREELIDHVLDCAECAEIYRSLLELERGAREIDPGVPVSGLTLEPGGMRPVLVWGGGLVAAAVAAAVLIWAIPSFRAASAPPGEALRQASEVERPVLVSPLGAVGAPDALVWRALTGAVSYRLEMLDALGEPIWSTTTEQTSVPWPAEVPAPRGVFYWRIVVELERGGSVVSELESFDVHD